MTLSLTLKRGEFPHLCPGRGCAVCAWVTRKVATVEQVSREITRDLGTEARS